MTTRNTLILLSAVVLSLLLFPSAARARFRVKLVTEPRAGRIIPNGAPAKFTVLVTDSAGRPVPFARLRLTLFSPKRSPFAFAETPGVKRGMLFHVQTFVVNGAYSFLYRVPARGTYRLVVNVFDTQHKTQYQKIVPIRIYLSSEELSRVLFLIFLFFVIGLLSGMLFEKSKAAAASVLLAALLLNPSVSRAQGGERRIMKSDAPLEELAKKLTYTLSVKVTPERAMAGKTTEVDAVLLDHKGNTVIVPVYFEFETVSAKDSAVLFKDTVFALKGKAKNHIQFFSGENHIVRINAYLQNPEGLSLKPAASFIKEIPVQPLKTPWDETARNALVLFCAAGAGAFAGKRIERNRCENAKRNRRKKP